MKRTCIVSTFFIGMSLLFSGCGGPLVVNTEALMKVKKVAVVSVSMTKLPAKEATTGNHSVLKKEMEDSIGIFAKELQASCNWKVLKLDSYKGKPALKKFSAKMEKNPYFKFWAKSRQKVLIGIDGLPTIPFRNLDPKRVPDPGPNYSGTFENKVATAEIIGKALGEMCKELNVDAVVVLHIPKFIGNTTGFKVSIGGKRTNGHIKYNPTAALVDSMGKVIIDMGSPSLDDLAPTEHNVPIYAGTGSNIKLDLKHSKVSDAFDSLEKRTLKKLAAEIAKTLVPPK